MSLDGAHQTWNVSRGGRDLSDSLLPYWSICYWGGWQGTGSWCCICSHMDIVPQGWQTKLGTHKGDSHPSKGQGLNNLELASNMVITCCKLHAALTLTENTGGYLFIYLSEGSQKSLLVKIMAPSCSWNGQNSCREGCSVHSEPIPSYCKLEWCLMGKKELY